jgi:hypothetical protein
LKFAVLVIACFLFLPAVFYYGIAGALTLVFTAAAVQELVAVFRPIAIRLLGSGDDGEVSHVPYFPLSSRSVVDLCCGDDSGAIHF